MPDNTVGKRAYINARLLDPATGMDEEGALLTDGETIADVGQHLFTNGAPEDIPTIDCKGKCLAPGLVDIRVQIREPGEEHKGTIESAGRSATAGGVTTMVCLPNTAPIIEDMSVVEFVARRASLIGLSKIYPYAAVTKGLEGLELAELGILAQAGAVAFTDGEQVIADAQVLRRALTYARTFDLLIIQHAEEPSLANGVMNAGEVATRLGLGTDGIRQAVVKAARRPTRRRERKEEIVVVEPTPVDRELGVLAALALQSHEVLDFLCDQTEQLLLGSEGREGEALLRCILTARPEVPDPAGVNTFLQKQTREDRAALLALLEDPTPEDPLTAATEILGKLAEQGILRELGSLGARLKSPDLTDGEAEDIMQQITDLQRIRSEAKNP